MPEKLPSTADGLTLQVTETTTPEFGRRTEHTFTGPVDELEAKRDELEAETSITGNVEGLTLSRSRGRGSLRVNFRRVWFSIDPDDQSVQELNSFDVVRSIYVAPYFATLTNAEIIAVRDRIEQSQAVLGSWSQLQKRLYGHLAHGQEQYYEPAYELILTWSTTSTAQLGIAAENVNTVQPRPSLSGPLGRLIDGLPAGEWLKRPTTVQSIGGGRFQVRVTYQWATKWSIIYGGTFTGEDP